MRILAREGIVIRLSRNLDKQRGFVTGAVATVCESLRGNAVFTARRHGTGNMVLVHPLEEDGARFYHAAMGMPPRFGGPKVRPWSMDVSTSTRSAMRLGVGTGMLLSAVSRVGRAVMYSAGYAALISCL